MNWITALIKGFTEGTTAKGTLMVNVAFLIFATVMMVIGKIGFGFYAFLMIWGVWNLRQSGKV